ncbi:sensor histidine kinase, partial [Clostridium perfringens]
PGIEPMEESVLISIRVTEDGEDIVIDVEDNGPGFDPETLIKLRNTDPGQLKKYRENGVGLKNVHERLRIRFGSRYGLMICSSPGYGSLIRIRIPKILT